ncbi:OprO/OprP family phosphate-selective porin [Marilutibacter aestuarii]|uniref:Porin n=1 Tax=Marilutibacter aestuarii TaxID=1706195 RepID=A0A508ADK4_9GAMM|nr:porin [Lysobacter aestuarii]TQD46641.1 hypothetical protein FKV25_06520 [Lysobacter aestuarii]
MSWHRMRLLFPVLLAMALLMAAPLALAQSPESDLPDQVDQTALPGFNDYVIPELPQGVLEDFQDDEGAFTWKPGVVLLYDWNAIDQDAVTEAAVGAQGHEDEWRAIRFTNRGRIGHSGKLTYLLSFEYKGFNKNPGDPDWSWTDIQLKYNFGAAGSLMVGKVKEASVYEMVGDSANLPHQERVLSPFFQSRSVGVNWLRTWGGERGTLELGAYNDAWSQPGDVDLGERGNHLAARITGLAWWHDDGARFLHLGANVRHVEDNDGILNFRGRPASNVLPNYVNTGDFAADSADFLGLEALWNHGPVSVLGEWVVNQVDAPLHGDPRFHGWYVTGSWVLTGETRPYDRKVGYARRVLPEGHWGAVELIGRVGGADLSDAGIDGGAFRIATLGANWWASRRLKMGVQWTRTDLDAPGGGSGSTDAIQTRLQWVY